MLKKRISFCIKKLYALLPQCFQERVIEWLHSNAKQNTLLEDVFSKNYKQKVLLSYIKAPFIQSVKLVHTSYLECYTAAKIFDELGFSVDVIECTQKIPVEKLALYKVVYGIGESLNLALAYPQVKTFFYGCGCCPTFSNKLSLQKTREFYEKTGKNVVNSARIAENFYAETVSLATLIIALGNNFVAKTYKIENSNVSIEKINCFYYDVYNIDLEKKDFVTSKKKFLWFGSAGCLHKGLDVAIEVFKKKTDIHLTICGANAREKDFFEYYKDVFSGKLPNISYIPFVDLESEQFKEIMNTHAAVVFPSLSEGGAPAVLNVMANGGLVPIISESCGLDVDEYGFMFSEISEQSVEQAIEKFITLSASEIFNISKKVLIDTRKKYSYKNYYKKLNNILINFV